MAYRIEIIPMTLIVLQGHSPTASSFKWDAADIGWRACGSSVIADFVIGTSAIDSSSKFREGPDIEFTAILMI